MNSIAPSDEWTANARLLESDLQAREGLRLAAILTVTLAAHAQTSRGTVTGTVVDQTGAHV